MKITKKIEKTKKITTKTKVIPDPPIGEENLEIDNEKNQVLKCLKNKLAASDDEDDNSEGEQHLGKKREITKTDKLPKEGRKREKKPLLDPNFNFETQYFYQKMTPEEKSSIKGRIDDYFGNSDNVDLREMFSEFPNLNKDREAQQYTLNLYDCLITQD